MRTNLQTETPSNRLGMMQEDGGKLSRKSNKIAKTPTQGSLAVVTPSTKISKREQAQAKKIKQGKKKGLADFFGQGPWVPAPLWGGHFDQCRRTAKREQDYQL